MKYLFHLFFIAMFPLVAQNDTPDKKKIVAHFPTYSVNEADMPQDLIGISNEQIKDHWKLYKGYVEQVNKRNEQLANLRAQGKGTTPEYEALRRRLNFEYDGMVLHKLYFKNMEATEEPDLIEGPLFDAIEYSFGSYEIWKNDFIQAGKSRGIGWALLCMDPKTGYLFNLFITDHEIGHVAGYKPLLLMDVWEHAYMIDYTATERGDYIDAFMQNINWPIVEKRYKKALKKPKTTQNQTAPS
jgi:Fe-Mn family superoxide dismutase